MTPHRYSHGDVSADQGETMITVRNGADSLTLSWTDAVDLARWILTEEGSWLDD